MSYTKHNFNSGDVLMASQLNEMEDQIALNETAIAGKQDAISDLETIRSNANSALQAHQPLKTINGESLAGEGDIAISADGMTDAQRTSLWNLLQKCAFFSEVTRSEIKSFQSAWGIDGMLDFNRIDFWELGTLRSNGTKQDSMIRLRMKVYVPKDVTLIRCESGYKCLVSCYNASGNGSGDATFYDPVNKTLTDGATAFFSGDAYIRDIDAVAGDYTNYLVLVSRNDNAPMDLDEYSNIKLLSEV